MKSASLQIWASLGFASSAKVALNVVAREASERPSGSLAPPADKQENKQAKAFGHKVTRSPVPEAKQEVGAV